MIERLFERGMPSRRVRVMRNTFVFVLEWRDYYALLTNYGLAEACSFTISTRWHISWIRSKLPVVVRFISNLNYRRCQFRLVVQQGESSLTPPRVDDEKHYPHFWKNKESWVKDRPRAGENIIGLGPHKKPRPTSTGCRWPRNLQWP